MRKTLTAALLVVLGTAMLWGAVWWHWQRTGRSVDGIDLVVYLVFIPVLAWGAAALLWRALRRTRTTPEGAAATPSGSSSPSPVHDAAARQAAALGVQETAHRLLAGGVAAPGADDAQALLALAAELPPLALDPELRAADGFGVFTRRSEHADAKPADPGTAPAAEEAPRAARAWRLAMQAVQEPLARLLSAHAAWQPPSAPDRAPETDHPTLVMPRSAVTAAPSPAVRVVWALPSSWPDRERQALARAAQAWLDRCRRDVPGLQWHGEWLLADSGEQALWQTQQRLALLHREGRHEPVLLVAADSGLDAGWIDELDAQQRLFTASRPQGWMPGEAAAALLLHPGAPGAPAGWEDGAPAVFLQPLALRRRERSADARGPLDTQALEDAFETALREAGWPAADVARVVSDHDLTAGRSVELFRGLLARLPGEDAAERCVCLGSACGHTGIVSALLCVLAAAQLVRDLGAPACALPVAHPHDRLAVLLTPAAHAPALPPSAADAPAA